LWILIFRVNFPRFGRILLPKSPLPKFPTLMMARLLFVWLLSSSNVICPLLELKLLFHR